MKKSYTKRIYINYIIINGALIGLSFLGFIFAEKYLPICVSICSLTGLGCLALLVSSQNNISLQSGKGSFVPFLLLRYLLMIIGLVASALIIRATMGENIEKTRYLLIIVCALPYFSTSLTLLITKQGDNNA